MDEKGPKEKLENHPIKSACTWAPQDSGGSNIWETECGEGFIFEDGSPKENGFLFCPYCGLELCEIEEENNQYEIS
jgi:hypothetical protein